jgi:DNA ligase-1
VVDFHLGQTLFAPTKTGNVKTWRCLVTCEDDSAILSIVTQTKLDGKAIYRHETITEGKNIGKSNETTPHSQAVSEAEARYRKQIKKGYQTSVPKDTNMENCNNLGLPKPMLAHPINKVKVVEFPAFFQPKLDGHRALATKLDGKMVMYSRGGDWITSMDHILEYLDDKVEEGQILDGELYVHGEKLQNIGSLIRRKQPGSEKVHYHVYDIMMDVPFEQRMNTLYDVVCGHYNLNVVDYETASADDPVKFVRTAVISDMEAAMHWRDQVIADGYEGGMLRTPDKGYLAGYKSRNLLKLKTFDDNEFMIVDVVEGKDRVVNDVNLKVACFVCEITPGGSRFEVTSMGDMWEKDKTWHDRENFIRKFLTVQHSGYTKDKIPWHPVALRLREDI